MRTIKFRSWDARTKRMDIPDGIANDIDGGRYQIMQYTGLKDKNGKEIYESDLLSGATTDKGIEVVFSEGEFWGRESNLSTHLKAEYFSGREVIGNIYEG